VWNDVMTTISTLQTQYASSPGRPAQPARWAVRIVLIGAPITLTLSDQRRGVALDPTARGSSLAARKPLQGEWT
jgi:hypothetical protein